MMITDAHLHIGSYPTFGVELDAEDLAEHLADHGISTGIVFSPDNEATAKAVVATTGAFGLYWANPKQRDVAAEARDYLSAPEFVGIKLHPLLDGYPADDPIVDPLAELAAERGVPVLVHCGHEAFSSPWLIEGLATRYPSLKIILGHMGHGHIAYINGAIAVAERRPNVWLETSGMPMGAKIAEACRRAGAGRVMYGSDSPFHDPRPEQLKIFTCGLGEAELALVMDGTAQALFFGDGWTRL
jgi:predicted TIM-barrel fold metal-dependent hydrolase